MENVAPQSTDQILDGVEFEELNLPKTDVPAGNEEVTEINELSLVKIDGTHGVGIDPFVLDGKKIYKVFLHHEPDSEPLAFIPYYTSELSIAMALMASIVDEYQYTSDQEAGHNVTFLAIYFNKHVMEAYKKTIHLVPISQQHGPYDIRELLDIPFGGGKVFIFEYNSVTWLFSYCRNPFMKDVGCITAYVNNVFVIRRNFSTTFLAECVIELADRVNSVVAIYPQFDAEAFRDETPEQQAQERFKHRLMFQAVTIENVMTNVQMFDENTFIHALRKEQAKQDPEQITDKADKPKNPKLKVLDGAMSMINQNKPT